MTIDPFALRRALENFTDRREAAEAATNHIDRQQKERKLADAAMKLAREVERTNERAT